MKHPIRKLDKFLKISKNSLISKLRLNLQFAILLLFNLTFVRLKFLRKSPPHELLTTQQNFREILRSLDCLNSAKQLRRGFIYLLGGINSVMNGNSKWFSICDAIGYHKLWQFNYNIRPTQKLASLESNVDLYAGLDMWHV